ncbi:MAG TPA: GNAT family N-acetyltransferase [Acidimicrobiales bacterium]
MIEIRRVRPDEYVAAGEVTASAWEPTGSIEDQEWLMFRARIADVAGRDDVAAVYVATEGGRILGSVTLEMEDRIVDGENSVPLTPDEAHVRVLGVAPAARRRAVGQTLMTHCANVARQNGKDRLTLNTSLKNLAAQSFYESIGYERQDDIDLEDGSKLCSYELNLR